MAWDQTDLDRIETAIANGERRVRLNGREVEHHSVGELLKARDMIKAQVLADAATVAGTRRPASFRSRTSKGL